MKVKRLIYSELDIVLLLCILLICISCTPKAEVKKAVPIPIVSSNLNNPNLEQQIKELKGSMLSYLIHGNPSYNKKEVNDCIDIIRDYVIEISKSNSKSEGKNVVETTIKKLNALNQKTNFSLIETHERELISMIIIGASAQKGYNSLEDDITESLREW